MVRSSSVGKNVNNPMPSYMKTTIGYINKNNINDLLLDIQAAKKDIN